MGGGQVAVALDLRNATRDADKKDKTNRQGVGIGDDVAHTIATSANNGVASSMAVRRLTPRECERLQGIPDDHTLVPVGNKLMSDSARYKMVGNSMAVPVMRKTGERIALVDRLMRDEDA